MIFCRSYLHDAVVGAVGILTRKPTNKVALKEDRVVLECSSNVSNSVIWSYDSVVISGGSCTTSNPRFSTSNNNKTTDCYLQAQGTSSLRLSGAYTCSDGSTPQGQAVVIIIGQCWHSNGV